MKQIIPFKKDIIFKTNLSEITSISLEHNLQVEDGGVVGNFMVSGDYKIADDSKNTENFSFDIPFSISIDERYLLDKVTADINDFYYEVINNSILSINIEVILDKLEERPLMEEVELVRNEEFDNFETLEVSNDYDIKNEENVTEEKGNEIMPENKNEIETVDNQSVEDRKDVIDTTAEVKSLFELFDDSSEEYLTYKVYMVREEDTIETITLKYGITKEQLENYNDIREIKIGDKLIIPAFTNAKS